MNVVFAVGCSNYDDPDVATLKFASKDAQRFADTVKEALNPDDTQVLLLHDEQQNKAYHPTRGNILRYLSWRSRLYTSDELESFYFFFSGHGFHSLDDEVDYLFASDSSGSALEDTAISFITLEKYIRRWKANYTVLFVDACRAAAEGGKGGITIENTSNVDVDSLCPSGMVTFCSCRPGQASYEADAIHSGVFTEGICRALSDNGKCSTIEQLDTYLNDQIPKISQECARPLQAPYSKVEPLAVKSARIVSQSTLDKWQTQEQEELTAHLMETTGSPDASTQSASDGLPVGRPGLVPQEERENAFHIRQLFSIYNTQRLGMAVIAFAFPLILFMVGWFNGFAIAKLHERLLLGIR